MSVPYNIVTRQAAIRINAIVGAIPTTLQTNYIVDPLTTTQVESSIFPLAAIQDAVLSAEERLAHAIADNATHPWRQSLIEVTADLANLDVLPSVANGGAPIIGAWGPVRDSDTFEICSEMSLDQVRRRVRNANSNLVCPVYWYNIAGGQIAHTRTNVVIECCVYDRDAQSTSLQADGDILLPDVLEAAYTAGAVAVLMRDDEFMQQAQVYARYFEQTLEMIAKSMTGVVPLMEAA